MKLELNLKTVGVGEYTSLTNEEIISAIARHGKIKTDNGKLVKYLMNNKHWSPLQHVFFGFRIQTRRSISAQIFRHRSLHFQEFSTRYSKTLGFENIELRKEHPTNRQSSTDVFDPFVVEDHLDVRASDIIDTHLKRTKEVYDKLIELKVAKECARDILPLCNTTIIQVSGTLRDLLAFLNVRCEEHSQLEVRRIATAMGEALEKELPNVFEQIDWRNGFFM